MDFCPCKIEFDGSQCYDKNGEHYKLSDEGYPRYYCEGDNVMRDGYVCKDNRCKNVGIFQIDCTEKKRTCKYGFGAICWRMLGDGLT